MRFELRWKWIAAFVLANVLSTGFSLRAQEADAEIADDRGFARYADSELLTQAIEASSASLAADFTLQLVEGERVLQRSHAGITADQAFALTVRMARETGDKATLERLAKASDKAGKKEWSEQLEAAQKLGAAARTAAPLKVSDKLSPDAQQVFGAVYDVVQGARLTGDTTGLEMLAVALPDCEDLSADQKSELTKLVGATRSEVAASLAPELKAMFEKMQGAARSNPAPAGTLALEIDGAVAVPVNLANTAPIAIANVTGESIPMTGSLAITIPPKREVPVRPKPGVSSVTLRKGIRVPKITMRGFRPHVTYTFVAQKTYRIPVGGFSLTGAGGGKQRVAIGK